MLGAARGGGRAPRGLAGAAEAYGAPHGSGRACPLCTEALDATEAATRVCACGYQVCAFCWQQLAETAASQGLEARCPACRAASTHPQPRPPLPLLPAAEEDLLADDGAAARRRREPRGLRGRGEDASTDAPEGPPAVAERRRLAHVRVIQRNLVYVVGLTMAVCREELLKRPDHFGKFGRIVKVSVNRGGAFAGGRDGGGTGSAYVTYARPEDARAAIAALDGTSLDGRPLRACFGTTKYCHAFLRGVSCANPGCLFLHAEAPGRDSFTKEEMLARSGGSGSFAAAAAAAAVPDFDGAGWGDAGDEAEAARLRRNSSSGGSGGSGSAGSANGSTRGPPSRRGGIAAAPQARQLPLPLQMQQMALNQQNQQYRSGGAGQGPLGPQQSHPGGSAFAASAFPPMPYGGGTMYGAAAMDEAQLRQLMMLSGHHSAANNGGTHGGAQPMHAPGGVNAALAAARAQAPGYARPAQYQMAGNGGTHHHYENPPQFQAPLPRQPAAAHHATAPYGAEYDFGGGEEAPAAAAAGAQSLQSRYRFANAAEDAAAAAAGRAWVLPGGGGGFDGGAAAARLQEHRAIYEAASAAEAEARRALPPPSGAGGAVPPGGGRARANRANAVPGGPFGGPAAVATPPPPAGQPREGRRHRRGGQRSGGGRQAAGGQ